jgi:hypothetical protein
MKYLLIGLIAFGSLSALAMETREIKDAITGDISTVITQPSLGDGVLIYEMSSQQGVCKALGYEKAVQGSVTKSKKYRGPLVDIGDNGLVSNGKRARVTRSEYAIDQIICLNKTASPKEETHKLTLPVHPDSGIPFYELTNLDMVCKLFGFEKNAWGSQIKDKSYKGILIDFTENGISARIANWSTSDYAVGTMVCLSKVE